MWDFSENLPLSDADFETLRSIIRDACGLNFDNDSRFIVERRIANRLRELGIKDYREYVFFLRYDRARDAEFQHLYDILTTNETYFFREEYQLKAFADEMLPEMVKTRRTERSLNIWSAGCSSGEEPYTLAMLLMEHHAVVEGMHMHIFGSDISQRCLKLAREGVYGANSFRTTDAARRDRFFDRVDNEHYRVKQSVRDMVSFGHLNLMDAEKIGVIPAMDVIFCRNVLIYFDSPTKKRVIDHFFTKLHSGGFLFLGHAESLMNITTAFKLHHFKNDMVYKKP